METQKHKRKWKSRKNRDEQSEDVETQCNNLYQLLLQKAPKLTPKIIPRGFDDDNLQNLCKTSKQKEDLQKFVEKNQNTESDCSICSSSAILHLDTVWTLDFASSKYKLEKIQLICENCKHARDTEKFVSSTVPESIVQHFIIVNYGTDPVIKVSARDFGNEADESILSSSEDEESEDEQPQKKKKKQQPKKASESSNSEFFNADGVLYAEVNQAYAVAYALKVLASNMQSLQVVDMNGNVFSENTDIAALLQSVSTKKTQKKNANVQPKTQKPEVQMSENKTTNNTQKPAVQPPVEKKKQQPVETQKATKEQAPVNNVTQAKTNGKQKAQPKEKEEEMAVDNTEETGTKKKPQAALSKKALLKKKLKTKKSA